MTQSVTLPWPPSSLSPNARGHWAIKAKAAAKARGDARIACQASGLRKLDWDAAHVNLTFHPPDNRARDLDNMLSAAKAALDGVADATGIDDSRWTLELRRGEARKGGEIIVTLGTMK